MTEFGYTALREQTPANQLVDDLVAAERAGFGFSVMSDHYFPWIEEMGVATTYRRTSTSTAPGRTPTGGWSQPSHQRSAERAWDENAKEFAHQVMDAAAGSHAERVIIAGDIRTRALLLDHLSPPLREAAVVVDREGPADSDATAEAPTAASEPLRAAVHDHDSLVPAEASRSRTAFSARPLVARSPKSESLPSSPSAAAIVRPPWYRSMTRGSM
jgi:hypothetical protein